MLTEISGAPFTSEGAARGALKEARRRYRVALRGAVVIEDKIRCAFYVHLPLGATGYSAAEWSGNLRSCAN